VERVSYFSCQRGALCHQTRDDELFCRHLPLVNRCIYTTPIIHGHTVHVHRPPLQSLFSLVNEPLDLEVRIASCELLQQLSPSPALLALHVELLHAHHQPPRLIYTDASVLDHHALPKDKIVAVCQLLVERDGRVRAGELAAQLELGERCEEQGRGILVRMSELEVVQLGGLLCLAAGLFAFLSLDGNLARHG
jgi:hypothetical protein